jgi:hypothetical protein
VVSFFRDDKTAYFSPACTDCEQRLVIKRESSPALLDLGIDYVACFGQKTEMNGSDSELDLRLRL